MPNDPKTYLHDMKTIYDAKTDTLTIELVSWLRVTRTSLASFLTTMLTATWCHWKSSTRAAGSMTWEPCIITRSR